MKSVRILVEGQAEETFVRDVLAPALWSSEVVVTATQVATKRLKSGGKFKGGVTSYERVAYDLRQLLRDSSARLVTTMLDLYRLPRDFPGWGTCPEGPGVSGAQRASHLEHAFAEDIKEPRFRPYLSVHEFEALIFAGLDSCSSTFPGSVAATLARQRQQVQTPEDINEGEQTAPSKRILAAYPGYEKAFHGPYAVGLIGINRLRSECPRFAQWLADLERIGSPGIPTDRAR